MPDDQRSGFGFGGGFSGGSPGGPAPAQFLAALQSINQAINGINVLMEGGGAGGAITDAPANGLHYGRSNNAWEQVLAISGGTLTGALMLAADPVAALGAATKQYVDAMAFTGGGGPIPVTVPLGGTGATNFSVPPAYTAITIGGLLPLAHGTGAFTASRWGAFSAWPTSLVCYGALSDPLGVPWIEFGNAGGTLAALTAIPSGAGLGGIFWTGHNGTNWQSSKAWIEAFAGETWTGSAQGTEIRMGTIPVGTTVGAKAPTTFVLDGSGNLTVAGGMGAATLTAGTPAAAAVPATGDINAERYLLNGVVFTGGAGGLSGMTAGQIPIAATATTVTSSANLSGDVTSNSTLITTIANNAVTTAKILNANVTYAKVQNVTAARLLGNSTGSAASPSEISLGTNLSFAGTVLNAAGITGNQTITITGDVDGSGATAITLILDTVNSNVGTFASHTVNAKGLTTAAGNLTGDVTTSGAAATIANSAVTLAKMQNRAASTLLGNPTGSAAAPSEITLGTGLSFAGSVLNASVGGTPGGTNTQVQYNVSGTSFGGSSGATFSTTALTSMAVALGSDAEGDIYYRAVSGALTRLARGSNGMILQLQSGLPSWQTIATGGGTVNSGTGPQIAQYPAGTSATVAGVTMSGDATIAQGGALTISALAVNTGKLAAGAVTLAKMENRAASTLLGNPTGSAATPGEITLGTGLSFAGTVLNATGGATGLSGMTAGQIPIAATATTITSSGNLSGDVTTSGSLATTLATVNANVGTFQGITVNAKGLVTAAANQGYLTGNQTITVTGDVDGSGTTAIALTLDTVNANVGSFTNANITVNGKGLITAAANGTAGGTGTITAGTAGEVALYTGTTTIDGFVMSGDATISASGVVALTTNSVVTTDITNANVTYAKIQNVANNRILGNTSGSAAAPSEIALPLVVSNGGTGAATLAVPSLPFSPTGGLVLCHGTGALTAATNWGQWDNYGLYGIGITGNAPYIEMGASSGTLGSPTATASGQTLGSLSFDGYGTAWNSASRATFRALANELWTASAQGTRFEISTTLLTTTTTAVRMTVAAGVTIGAPTGGDKGAGTLNATAVYAAGTLLTSDARLKQDITPLPPDCLGLVAAIEPKQFRFIPREDGPAGFWERRNWGFLAQDIQQVFPDAVEEDTTGNLSYSPSDLTACLWKALQELAARVAALEG